MGNFEKIKIVWNDLDSAFEKNQKFKSKREFLEFLLGGDKAIVKLRSLVMKDLEITEERIAEVNDFFAVLENAKERLGKLSGSTKIESLNYFVWDFHLEEVSETKEVNLWDYVPTVIPEYAASKQLIEKNFFSSVYRLNGKDVEMMLLDPEDQSLIHFENEISVIAWLQNKSSEVVQETNSFESAVYAYLINGILKHETDLVPISFVSNPLKESSINSGIEDREFPTTDKRKFNCKFKWENYLVDNRRGERVVYCGTA